jgi:hypothetical protein
MELWFSDSEVFAHDTLWVFKRQSDGRIEVFWNDPDGVEQFIFTENPVLCGFNFRDYDAHILKATLLGWSAEDIHNVSQTIIFNDDRTMVWTLFQGHPWIELPPIIDLFHDIVPRKGLKEIEGNIGMSIEESSVSFDIDRPLTEEERDDVLRYCIHDVTATERLYDLRYDYVKAKSDLCELRGIDPLTMLKHTNARIVSEVLGAQRLDHHPIETYTLPENLDITHIPDEVIAYSLGINTENCMNNDSSVEFMFHGCPTKFALGGIHGAVPSYAESSSDDRVILLQDVGSYYPSLIINNGYMSRAVADPSIYEEFYHLRMKAKADGDKATAEAAKLVLNTTYGTFKDTYNKLFDPMQGTRVCLSGQLYILDLIGHICTAYPSVQLIQLNTDGWVISCDRADLDGVQRVVSDWSERTHFTVDTAEVERIVQANVNNYVMRDVNGNVKAKGGVVALHAGGNFKSNSMTIVDKAVTDYLLDGIPIEDTVNACDDLSRFQIIAKAGSTFQKVVHERNGVETPVQRVNRVYATTDTTYGGIFKVKMEDSKEIGRQRIPLTPDHCFIDNENRGLTTLDKSWYIGIAKRKATEFVKRDKKEKEQMAEVNEPTNELAEKEAPKPRRRTTTKTTQEPVPEIPSFRMRLLQLQRDMAEASKGVSFDKVVEKIGHEYADTQQYKVWLSQKATNLDIIFGLDIHDSQFLGVINPDAQGASLYGVQVKGHVILRDAHSDEEVRYVVSGLGINATSGYAEGGAHTNALRNFILNDFLLDNMGRDGDDVGLADVGGTDKGYVAPDQKAALKQGIKEQKAAETQFATVLFMSALHDKIMQARAIEGNETKFSKILGTYYEPDGTPKAGTTKGKSLMEKKAAVDAMSKAEEIIAGAGE